MIPYDRDVLVEVIIYHAVVKGPPPYAFSCNCGFGRRPEHLGLSYADHVADVFELAMQHREVPS